MTDLQKLLESLEPELHSDEFVFCSLPGHLVDYTHLKPQGSFMEKEGLTLVLPLKTAQQENLQYSGVFKQITLSVHSSLNAVGLTAAVAAQLSKQNISANVIAAYYHDHIFVPAQKANQALAALQALSNTSG